MHECPDCWQACYCNGDIDDCAVGDTAAEDACVCCLNGSDESGDEDYWEPEEGDA